MTLEETLRELLRSVIREEFDRLLVELKADPSGPRLLDREGAARLLGVSTKTVDRLVKEGMPHLAVGGAKRFEGPEIVGWLRGRRIAGLRLVRER